MAADHLDGPVTIEVPVLNNNFNYWYVGIGINYDISSLYKNNRNIAKAKLQARQAQESYELAQEQTHNTVQENYVNLLTAFSELRTQEKNVELADENFTVIRNRYQNELALLTDMLDASNTKLSAEEKDAFVRNTAALGLTPSAAIKVFVHMFNECGGFPFEVRRQVSDDATTYLSADDYGRFASALDSAVPAATRELLDREFSWED